MYGRLAKWAVKNAPDQIVPDEEALLAWLRRVGPHKLLDELGVNDKGERNTLFDVIRPVIEYDKVLECHSPDFALLSSAHAETKSKRSMQSEVQASWLTLPGDIFHLPSMPDGTPNSLFLMLRHIRQVPADSVTGRPDSIRFGDAQAKRVARVCAPFRYAITQSLARVFADIGLPNNYNERRETAAQRFFDGDSIE